MRIYFFGFSIPPCPGFCCSCPLFFTPPVVQFAIPKVATMAGGELLVIANALADSDQQVALASDWSIAMDLLLTELKVPQIFHVVCLAALQGDKDWVRLAGDIVKK